MLSGGILKPVAMNRTEKVLGFMQLHAGISLCLSEGSRRQILMIQASNLLFSNKSWQSLKISAQKVVYMVL